MEKLKRIYIICFVLQVIIIPIIGLLLVPMVSTTSYQSFYCKIDAKGVDENFWKEFRKLFPTDYNHYCHDTSFYGLGMAIIIFGIWILLFLILIAYSIIFCLKMRRNKFILDYCVLSVFIICFILLLPTIIFYIYLTPIKTSFDNPEIIFIFDKELNNEIKEKMKTVVERKIYGIIGIFLILIKIVGTLIKINILYKAKKENEIDENLLMS